MLDEAHANPAWRAACALSLSGALRATLQWLAALTACAARSAVAVRVADPTRLQCVHQPMPLARAYAALEEAERTQLMHTVYAGWVSVVRAALVAGVLNVAAIPNWRYVRP